MLRLLTTTTVLALTAGSVAADGIAYGRLSYDTSNFSSDAGDADVSSLQGAIEYDMNRFLLGGEFTSTDISGDFGSADVSTIRLSAGYVVSQQILAGLGYLSVDSGGADNSGLELFAQYEAAPLGVALNITDFDSGTDTRGYGHYAVNNTTEVGLILADSSTSTGIGYLLSGDYEAGRIDARGYFAGNTDGDGNTLGVRGDYDLGNAFRGLGGFATTVGGTLDSNSFYVGAGYQIVDGAWIDASYGKTQFQGADDIDRLRIVASFEVGQQRRLDRKMDQAASDDQLASFAALGF